MEKIASFTVDHLRLVPGVYVSRVDHLILAGSYESKDIVPLLKEMYTFMAEFEGEVPGAAAKDCGNYLDMNLPMAKYLSKKYLTEVLENITDEQLNYPA